MSSSQFETKVLVLDLTGFLFEKLSNHIIDGLLSLVKTSAIFATQQRQTAESEEASPWFQSYSMQHDYSSVDPKYEKGSHRKI